MKADFSGYATKAGLLCSDGRTIMPGAFKHQDKMQVPLVWQHGHNDPENVLGHVLLENREDGVYAHAFFNNSAKASHAKILVDHKDINALSIWANELVERGKKVLHGAIREVSLVLSGANPGALIENVTIHHGDGVDTELDDEVIIYTGLELEHTGVDDESDDDVEDESTSESEELKHAEDDDETIEDVYNSMNDKQKKVLHYMLGEAVAKSGEMKQSSMEFEDKDVQEFYESMDEDQQAVLQHMLDSAIEFGKTNNTNQEGTEMTHNVFEKGDSKSTTNVLSHSDIQSIVADAQRSGSLKGAVEGYALAHGITNIDQLFPDAQSVSTMPEFIQRRAEWVNQLLNATRKSPFSRIKTLAADITADEARAKGYIKGNLKKEEFFSVSKRVTTPTTIYKKQKLDRDDMIDITDFDVVLWLKAEMRIMLDEEIARAILIGDGRDIASDDKINEQNIRPIAKDHELFTTTINVNIDDANSSITEVIDAIVENRRYLRGSGMPTMYTTETYISKFLLLKDSLGRRIYKSLDEVAAELRVSSIVPVEVMEEDETVVAVIVNPNDYAVGADKGGAISMFDDFDIDYNQYKYLIETRISGALVKLKSALVVKKVAAALVVVIPAEPVFDGNSVTITNQTGVIYKDGDGVTINALGSPYAVATGVSYTVNATPDTGYYFPTSENDSWTYVGE